MKTMMRLMAVCFVFAVILAAWVAQAGELVVAEKMTKEELVEIRAARDAVSKAKAKVDEIEKKIAKAHGFTEETWPEWRTWVSFDGDYILQYKSSSIHFSSGEYDPVYDLDVIGVEVIK